jgi:hypothetical protein
MLRSSDEKDILDGLRSTLGLSVANHFAYGVVMNTELNPFDDYNKENVEWVRDMEGEVYSTVPANVDKNGLIPLTIEELGQKLRDLDIIVPYGVHD